MKLDLAAAAPLARVALSTTLSLCLLTSQPCTQLLGGGDALAAQNLFTPTPNLSEEQQIVVQAWKLADKNYADRNFAGQDWFETRQKMVKKKYESREEAYAEISRMLATLGDKYTRFLTPSKFKSVYAVATGDVAGIGVELSAVETADDGTPLPQPQVALSAVFEDGPADKAGLLPGDVLQDADGNDLRGLSPEEAAGSVRGSVGTKLRLVYTRKGEAEPTTLILTRGPVKIEAVTSSMGSVGGGKVGLVRIKQFSTSTAEDVKAALGSLSADGAKAFVLDLRGNTGGYFPGGVDVARLFLKKDDKITFTVDRTSAVTTYEAYADGDYLSQPLAVLVDKNTASASEVLSGALHDNKRATLVGSKTFGKAVIQNVEELSDGSAVVVTIARYETPARLNINGKGLEADVLVDCPLGTLPLKKAAAQCVPSSVLSS